MSTASTPRAAPAPGLAGRLATVPGTGPRHLAFHPDGEHLFLVNELASTIMTLRRDGRQFTVEGRLATRVADASRANLAAAVRVTPSGRHVLVSNRGDDSVAVYRFDPVAGPASAELTLLGHVTAPGACPRELVVAPDGRHVLVACQDSDLIASYPFDDAAGTLGEPVVAPVPTPVCLVLAPLES